jgi:SNF2 family DNA or RNA helicase
MMKKWPFRLFPCGLRLVPVQLNPQGLPPVPDSLRLHSAYRDRKLFVWGESAANRSAPARVLPCGAPPARIRHAIGQIAPEKLSANYRDATIWVPTRAGKALERGAPSQQNEAIGPWILPVAILDAPDAFALLDACNRNPYAESPDVKIAPTTRFWGAAFRFVAALASRERFLPSVSAQGHSFHARWLPVLAAPDRQSLRDLAAAMPPAARAITLETGHQGAPPEDDPAHLLSSFVEWMMDAVARVAHRPGRPVTQPRAVEEANFAAVWINRLCSVDSQMPGDRKLLAGFTDRVKMWQRPALREAAFPWQLGFRLQEPVEGAKSAAWRVHCMLRPVAGGPALAINDKSLSRSSVRNVNRQLAKAASVCGDIREGSESFRLDVTGAFRFLTETAVALQQEGFAAELPEWWTRHESAAVVRARPVLKPSAASNATTFSLNELMQFDWEVAIGGEKYTREELDRLAESTAPLVKVHGKWLPFEPQSIRAALELWKREPAPAREVIRMALGGAEVPAGVVLEEARGEGWIGELIEKLGGKSRFEELPVPSEFQGTLRPYQVRGFSWLAFLRQYGLGACLADDMGLGKTIQALALLGRERAAGVIRPTLLVCPTSVVGNWRKEAARFAPDLPVLVHHGVARTRGPEFLEEAARHALIVSSYSLVHRDIEVLKDVPWSGIILDEAQNIKNPETHQSRAIRSLAADYRIALTGTPVENNVGELWAIMEFLNPGFLGNAAEFRRNFLLPIQKRADPDAVLKLRKLTAPFILRRLKTDRNVIEDLPEKMEMKVFCNLTPEQASLYKSVVDDAARALDSTTGIQRKGVILATLTKLKQVCNHPAQFLGDQSPLPGRSGKLARLTEMVEELLSEGDRALIFSQFADMGERLRSHLLATFGQETLLLHGGVPAHKRQEMVERFQSGDENAPRLFVLSLKAGGTGLNLTAANHVFHFDRWWNPAVENQATDRAFRIGQSRNVQVHKFVCVGTLEEKIDEMIERKKAIADNVVGAGEAWLTELSTAEIKDLFALRQEALG